MLDAEMEMPRFPDPNTETEETSRMSIAQYFLGVQDESGTTYEDTGVSSTDIKDSFTKHQIESTLSASHPVGWQSAYGALEL